MNTQILYEEDAEAYEDNQELELQGNWYPEEDLMGLNDLNFDEVIDMEAMDFSFDMPELW